MWNYLANVRADAELPLKNIMKNGVEYVEAQKFNWTTEVDKSSVLFTNLFNGDKTLGISYVSDIVLSKFNFDFFLYMF